MSPCDPRFLDLTPEEIEAEYWAHHYFENADKEEFSDDDWDLDSVLQEIESVDDPDDWETVIDSVRRISSARM